MTKINLEINLDQADQITEQQLKRDADILWGYCKEGCAISYQYLEGLKSYMHYCGVEWVPPVETNGMEVCIICDGGPGNYGACGCGMKVYE